MPARPRPTAHGHRAPIPPFLRRLCVLVPSLLLCLVVLAGPAAAHTGLESSSPPAGVEVVGPLDAVTLTYTAPVTLLPGTVVARSQDGRTVAAEETVGPDRLVVTATFEEPLGVGTWTVAWRVLAQDSHPRTGEVPLVVSAAGTQEGAVAPPRDVPATSAPAAPDGLVGDESVVEAAEAQESEGSVLERLGSLARVLFYVGLLVAAGLALFKAGPHAGMSARARQLAGIALTASLVGIVSGVAEVVLHVAAVSGRGVRGAFDLGTWRAVLSTGLGPALLLRTAGLTLLAVGARRRVREGLASGPDGRQLLGALIAIASFQFVGHTASAAPPLVVRSADLVHALGAAVWVGGLVGLAVTARTGDPIDRSITVGRFSTWATGAVAAVTVAGVALAWVNLPSLSASWQTLYGQLLLAKLGLVGFLLLLGAHNHFNVVPDVTAGNPHAAAELQRVVRFELGLVAAVVVLTALLVNTSPL